MSLNPQWDRTPPNPWGRVFRIADRPDIPPSVRQAFADLSRTLDTQEVWAPPGTDLGRVCAVAGVRTVRLYANTIYYVRELTLTKEVEITGPRSAVIAPQPNYTGTRRITIYKSATGKSGTREPIILRGFTSQVPIVAYTRAELTDLYLQTDLVTASSSQIELNGERNLVSGCYTDNAVSVGIYCVESGATGSRLIGNDFSTATTAIEGWAADGLHLGDDTNHGVVVLH